MKASLLLLAPLSLALCACSTYTTPRYAINAETNVALKTLGASGIGVGEFTGPAQFDAMCRAAGPLAPPDGMSHTAYLKKALEDELRVAGAYAATGSRVTLSATVNKLEFSSARALLGGTWNIEITLRSSNGSTMPVSEHYEFDSGYVADTACKQTAEAFFPAAQDLIKKAVTAPQFKALVQ